MCDNKNETTIGSLEYHLDNYKPDYPKILKAYKKRERSLQRRISAQHGVNKRLIYLLQQCDNNLSDGLLKDMIKNEFEMLKYKYY